jgi:hypothetical protein
LQMSPSSSPVLNPPTRPSDIRREMRTDRNIVYYCASDRGHLVHLKCKEIREFLQLQTG